MGRTPPIRLALPVFLSALVLLASCAPNPQIVSGSESDYLIKIRADYLASHPHGEFNDFIKRGEVVKGMDFLEVLAAWGHPEVRKQYSPLTEQWVYKEEDPDSKNWILYTFTFHRNVLTDWQLTRNVASGGSIDLTQPKTPTALSKGAVPPETNTSGVPIKH